ncbi:MAG: Ig-like domain-containing protein [Terracidiphilus sp.]|jgi:hypothetical protein
MFDRIRLGTLMFICLAVPFVGCGSSNDIDSLTVTPTTLTFEGAGLSAQLTAIATIGHGSHPATNENVTDLVAWTAVGSEVAAVTSSGLVTSGEDTGVVQVTASIHGFTGLITSSCSVTVEAPTSSAVSKKSSPVAIVDGFRTPVVPGETRQLRAVGTSGTEGVQEDLTDRVTWSSSNPAIATVSKSGAVTGLSRGTTTIMAAVTNPDKSVAAYAVGFTVTE